jgi:A/G-specific adenine glycosylase
LLEHSEITSGILSWYDDFKRDLPWRKSKNPYEIWLSEVILQQTRVNQGLPYYLKFIEMFPQVEDLARAPEQQVLRAWEGLGYYSRARNLHACAKIIYNDFNGNFPKSIAELQKLPGIGPYTASAISSFCFNEPAAVVDGNVYRVLARIFGITSDIRKSYKEFHQIAGQLLPPERAGEFNQAIMEFGALQCTPKSPDCSVCPVATFCVARKKGLQDQLPYKSPAKPPRERFFHYLVVQQDNNVLMRMRTGNDIWKNMYDFPLIEKDDFLNEADLLSMSEVLLNTTLALEEVSPVYQHQLSHQKLYVRFYSLRPEKPFIQPEVKDPELKLTTIDHASDLPKPVLISRYLNDHIF